MLLGYGANAAISDLQNYTPLKYAVACGHHACAQKLLSVQMAELAKDGRDTMLNIRDLISIGVDLNDL